MRVELTNSPNIYRAIAPQGSGANELFLWEKEIADFVIHRRSAVYLVLSEDIGKHGVKEYIAEFKRFGDSKRLLVAAFNDITGVIHDLVRSYEFQSGQLQIFFGVPALDKPTVEALLTFNVMDASVGTNKEFLTSGADGYVVAWVNPAGPFDQWRQAFEQ